MSHSLGYRKSVFAKAGIDGDQLRSWNEFVAAGRKLTVDKNGRHPGESGFDAKNVSTWGFGMARTRQRHDVPLDRLMRAEGMKVLKDDTWEANWTNPTAVKIMTFLTDLITKYQIESDRDITYDNEAQAVNFGQSLFAVGVVGSQKYGDIVNKAAFDESDLALLRWPSFDGRPEGSPADSWGWAQVMSEQSKNKAMAWEFLKHYQSPESDLINVKIGGQLPTRLPTLDDPYFNQPDAKRFRFYLQYMADTSYMNQYQAPGGHNDELILAFHSIVLKGTPVEEALKQAADNYNRRIKK
jgi:multiple sugar transport system substrate-binding protein